MKKKYDFSKAKVKKGPVVDAKSAKVQISMRLDGDLLQWAMTEADKIGVGYQTFMQMKLREAMEKPAVETRLERIEREIFGKKRA